MWKFYIVHYILTRYWESLLLRLQGIFEGTSEVLKRKNKTERYFSIEVEIFSEKGNSLSSLYWINIKVSSKLPPVSLCSKAPHSVLFRGKSEDLGLPGMSWCSECFQALLLLWWGWRDRAGTTAAKGGHFPPFSPAVAVSPDTHSSPLSAVATHFPGGRQRQQQEPRWVLLPAACCSEPRLVLVGTFYMAMSSISSPRRIAYRRVEGGGCFYVVL